MIGSLLGDGHLRRHRRGFVFEFLQTSKRKFYVEWKHKLLGDLAIPKIYHQRGEHEYYKIVTKTHPGLEKLHEIFYKGGRKEVPENVGKLLTPFTIAVWFMDDGSKSRNSVYFNTQGFNVEGQFRLAKALRRFHIIANLNRDGEYYRLRVLKKSNSKFLKLVGPHVLEEFAYKFPEL